MSTILYHKIYRLAPTRSRTKQIVTFMKSENLDSFRPMVCAYNVYRECILCIRGVLPNDGVRDGHRLGV